MNHYFIVLTAVVLMCACGTKEKNSVSTNAPLGTDSFGISDLNGVFEVVKITKEHQTCSSEGKAVNLPTWRFNELQTDSRDQNSKVKMRLCKDRSCSDFWSYDPDGATWNSSGFWAYPISSYGCGPISGVNHKIFLQFTRAEIVQTQSGINLERKRYRLEFDEFDCSRMRAYITQHENEFICHSKINVEEFHRVK